MWTTIAVSPLAITTIAPTEPTKVTVFRAKTDGYDTYRIPSVIVTPKGTVLAFCEGRVKSTSDTGNIDLIVKRSIDGGKTWGAQEIVWDDADNTCGNPCPVIDRATGTIWMLMTHNLGTDKESDIIKGTSKGSRTVWITSSTDDGKTWTKPTNITPETKRDDWTWYATGPGCGIELKSGRLVIPCDHRSGKPPKLFSHVIHSDDHGKSWKIGGIAGPDSNECEVVELLDGKLLLNMRNYNRTTTSRSISFSNDEGKTWSNVEADKNLIEPLCQASIRRYSHDKSRILFSNPADPSKRKNMTIRLSYDEAKTWPVAKSLHEGPAAYSCLTVMPDGNIGIVYESGVKSPYEEITFATLSLEWLTDGKDVPPKK